MNLFITTLCLTFPLFLAAALMVNFCKKRARKTRHGLTGMCHQSGGTMCSGCASSMQRTLPSSKGDH